MRQKCIFGISAALSSTNQVLYSQRRRRTETESKKIFGNVEYLVCGEEEERKKIFSDRRGEKSFEKRTCHDNRRGKHCEDSARFLDIVFHDCVGD